MPQLNWLDSFSSGDDALDAQHKDILDTFNALIDLLDKREFAQSQAVCRRLRDKVDKHCAFEERLLAEMGYPTPEAHALSHAKIKQSLDHILLCCLGDCSRSQETACQEKLAGDVVRQVLIADLEFKSFVQEFKARGGTRPA